MPMVAIDSMVPPDGWSLAWQEVCLTRWTHKACLFVLFLSRWAAKISVPHMQTNVEELAGRTWILTKSNLSSLFPSFTDFNPVQKVIALSSRVLSASFAYIASSPTDLAGHPILSPAQALENGGLISRCHWSSSWVIKIISCRWFLPKKAHCRHEVNFFCICRHNSTKNLRQSRRNHLSWSPKGSLISNVVHLPPWLTSLISLYKESFLG